MVLSSWKSHRKSSPGLLDECRTAPSGRRPKTKPDDLGCGSACTGCQSLHPPSPFINITQPSSNDRHKTRVTDCVIGINLPITVHCINLTTDDLKSRWSQPCKPLHFRFKRKRKLNRKNSVAVAKIIQARTAVLATGRENCQLSDSWL